MLEAAAKELSHIFVFVHAIFRPGAAFVREKVTDFVLYNGLFFNVASGFYFCMLSLPTILEATEDPGLPAHLTLIVPAVFPLHPQRHVRLLRGEEGTQCAQYLTC